MLPILQSILTLALLLGAFGFMATRLLRLAALVRAGAPVAEALTGRPAERLAKVVRMVFGHEKVLEDPWAGFMHVFFLYGFMTLGIGHVEVVLEGLTSFLRAFGRSPFGYESVLPPALLKLYHLSQDAMAFMVVLMAGIALGRRLSGRIGRLMPRSQDAERILWLIVWLYVTFFLLQGSTLALRRLATGDASFVASQPFTSVLASALAGLSVSGNEWLRGGSFWAHVGVFLGFACYIPISKHMHLVFAGPNIYFFRRQRFGLPPAVDFENSEKFGIDRVQELPWKTLLDTFACTECGRCNAACPAHTTGKPLLPMKVLHDVKLNLRYRNGEDLLALRDRFGNVRPDKQGEAAAFEPRTPLVAKAEVDREAPGALRSDGAYTAFDGQVHVDELWACTTCAACVQVCPVMIDSVPGTLIGLRQSLVMMESEFPQEVTSAFKGMEVKGNPWGVGQDRREEWAEELEVPTFAQIAEQEPGREVEYLFWVGCAGATDPRARKTQRALVKILKAAKVDFAMLGCEEKCTGDPARRMGNEYLFNQLATENIETLKQYKFKKIFASCPHCFNSLKNDYKELGANYAVFHHTELIAELLKDGRVPLKPGAVEGGVTFHDPCYLGRYNQGYEPPRQILQGIGAPVAEMEQSRERGYCCGAGGGRIFMEETLGKRVNVERTEQALATGAKTIAVGCPFCMTMLTDGTKAKNVEETVQVKDLAELVAERLAPQA
ncbi:MAG: (Fe-S)-binding protein [Vicinamibacteria bacterium]